MVRGRRMRVRADHEAGAAVEEMPHRLLLAGRLGMHVDDRSVASAPQRARDQLAVDRAERIVEWIHEDAPHGVDDQYARAVLRFDHRGTAAGRALRKIEWADHTRCALDEDQRLLLVPRMVAERDGISPGVDQLRVDRLGDAETAG